MKYNYYLALSLVVFISLTAAGLLRQVIRWKSGDGATCSENPNRAWLPALQQRNTVPAELRTFPLVGLKLSDERRKMILSETSRWCEAKSGQMGVLIHALRLRSLACKNPDVLDAVLFDKPLSIILDDTHYKKWALGREPVLFDTLYGAVYKLQGIGAESKYVGGVAHVDQVLATLGELCFPLTTCVVTHSGRHQTLADVLEDSLKRWTPIRESEWSLVAYCDYLHHQSCWISSTGETHSLDDVLSAILSRLTSPCFGTHRLYALAKVCMRERTAPGTFSAQWIREAESVLRTASKTLTENQCQDGGWPTSWKKTVVANKLDSVGASRLEASLSVTGHMLEWFSIADEDLRPSRDVIERAARYVETELVTRPEKHFGGDELPGATHAVRGLFNLCCASGPTEATIRR